MEFSFQEAVSLVRLSKLQESLHKISYRKSPFFDNFLFRVIFCEAIAIYGVIVSILLNAKPKDWEFNKSGGDLNNDKDFHDAK